MNGQRALLVVAGLAGMIGVALAAAGAHLPGGERLATAGNMAMAQAPALLALGFFVPATALLMSISAWAIALGLIGFSGALAFHALSGSAALSFVAPIGGTTMMLGWLGIAVASLLMRKR
ncbi:DUF423 domain-containing protein [Kaistia defluvii]|uniref:DUF423 domain-containing protein n=1 Tax=Kaistia defluvii TaxID=410841 RepID=UPI00225B4D4F|nr:DUF423 domain-containing protein [Kaistia defluvii]MCX5517260.1 DUF423 domain-containing protein [Kaistia defluvii]